MRSASLIISILSCAFARKCVVQEEYGCEEICETIPADINPCSYDNVICQMPSNRVCKVVQNQASCPPRKVPKFNCKGKIRQIEMVFRNICVCVSRFIKAEMCELTKELSLLLKSRDEKGMAFILAELGNLDKAINKAVALIMKDLTDNTSTIMNTAGSNIDKAITGIVADIESQLQALLNIVITWTAQAISDFVKDTQTGAGPQLMTYLNKITTSSISAVDKIISDALNQEKNLIAAETSAVYDAINSAFKSFEKKLLSTEIVGTGNSNKAIMCLLEKYSKNIFIGIEGIVTRDALAVLIILRKIIEKTAGVSCPDTIPSFMLYETQHMPMFI